MSGLGCLQSSCELCATERGCLYCGVNNLNEGYCMTSDELRSCPGIAWNPAVSGCLSKPASSTSASATNQTSTPPFFTPSPQILLDSTWTTAMYLVLCAGLVLSAILLGVVLFFAWRRRSRLLQPLGYERLAFRVLPHSNEKSSTAATTNEGAYVEVV